MPRVRNTAGYAIGAGPEGPVVPPFDHVEMDQDAIDNASPSFRAKIGDGTLVVGESAPTMPKTKKPAEGED